MKPHSCEKLLGYLLDALDGDESAAIDRAVARDDSLHGELTHLVGQLQPLSLLQGYYRDDDILPPPSLAEQTSEWLWQTLDHPPVESEHEPIPQPELEPPLTPELLPQPLLRIDPPSTVGQHPRHAALRTGIPAARPKPAPPARTWLGAVVSMGVGLLFAVLFFPIFDFVKAKVIVRVAQVLMRDVEENIEYYKQLQETNAVVRAREADGAVIVAKSHWRTIRQDETLVDHQLPRPTVEILDTPITALSNAPVALLCDPSLKTPLTLMLQPNRWLGVKRLHKSFDGGNLFISDDHVYFRTVPMSR